MKQVRLGQMTVDKVLEDEGSMPFSFSLPQATAADLAALREWYWDETLDADPAKAMFTLSVHSFVVRMGGKTVIVDTCSGNHKNRSVPLAHQLNTPYLQRLEALGIRREEIDMVVCTHLHLDHIGWNTMLVDGQWVPTFPNARYVFGRRDFDFFSTQHHEPFHAEAYEDSVKPVIEAGLAHIVDEDAVLHGAKGEGIWLEGAFGHSPGSCLIHAQSGGGHAVFSGDTFHHPVQLCAPQYPFFADHDPAMAVATRTGLFERYADTNTVVFPAHFRGTTAGHIVRRGDAFAFAFLSQD